MGEIGKSADAFVFWTVIPQDLVVSRLFPRLDANERGRVARFHFDQDRNAFAVAHALLRYGMDRVGGIHPWQFRQMPGGKPVLVGDHLPKLHFNLSHSRSLAAVAISRTGPLGVDVEKVESARGREDVAGIAFSPAERALLKSLAGENDIFFTLWTLKEATIKATGQGLSADLQSFAFRLDPPRLQAAGPDGSRGEEWCFHSSRVADCQLAVAVKSRSDKRVVFRLSEVPDAILMQAPI